MKYKLITTLNAEELLDNILKYLVNKLKNPQAASHLLDEIEHIYSNLEKSPGMYACPDDSFMKSNAYRNKL